MVASGAFTAIDRRVEVIRGEITQNSPAGPIHDDVIEYLRKWSYRSVDESEIDVRGKTGLNLPDLDSRPEPDVFWVKAGRYFQSHPTAADTLLAIEVGDSSLRFDRTTKANLYAESGIAEYWVVDVAGRCIYLMREVAADGHYGWQRTATIDDQISPIAQPDAILDIADLFDVKRS